ncbi:MAG: hypothetical protein HY856_13450 [Burkholderiales bacterium]|nr:hypothetical protein [Burkholderiales bacterium]
MTTPQHVLMDTLRRALSLKRPYGSREEGMLLAALVDHALLDRTWIDAAGNLHIDLRSERRHTTLFVAHVDTVHTKGGINAFDDSTPTWKAIPAGPQVPKLGPNGMPMVGKKTRRPVFVSTRDNALGADDGAGVAILAGLIAARKPAYYVFTRGEECGGVGARHLADFHAELLAEFDRAIAFDRRGTTSVITHQGRGRCASEAFGEALSTALNDQGMLYMPDDTGIYTDTAEFTDIIPECTNVSVGYENEHGDRESLDTQHLQMLFGAVLAIDFDALPTVREPGDDDLQEMPMLNGWGGLGITAEDVADTEPGDDFDPNDPFAVDPDGAKFREWFRKQHA